MSQPIVLEACRLKKRFGGVQALNGADLAIERGTVHALLGENGAGKSTLMKLLAGLLEPDTGEIRFQGRVVRLRNPHAALRLGIAMIHQELMPFPELSVAENILIGQEPGGCVPGWINRRQTNQTASQLLARVGLPVSPHRRMGELGVAEMQMVEIARALAHRTEVIIMDEPTSALSEREVGALFRIIRDLRSQGSAIIYISHKLEEVFDLADQVTVMRDGRRVATMPVAEATRDELINLMVGREWTPPLPRPAPARDKVALEVRGLTRPGAFQGIHFQMHRGEILGLAGLMGAGRTELARALYGLDPAETGFILVNDRPVAINTPADAIRLGIGYVGEDRRLDGLVDSMSVRENVTLASLRACCAGPFIQAARECLVADAAIRDFAIKATNRSQAVETLSGGNQQKVVIARAMLATPVILILDEPTRGIDIGAKAEVHALISRLAAAGKAILLISSELPELLSLADRILVLRAGRIAGEFDAALATQENLLRSAMIPA